MENIFVADFETTTKEDDCRVWAWAVCDVSNKEDVIIDTTIDSFMEWCRTQPDNVTVYFHNLKFDCQFIINWLFNNGFTHVEKSSDRASRTFKTMISDKGLYYGCEVVFHRKGKNIKKVTFFDSMKLLPMSVESIAEAFRLPFKKLKIDYDAHNDLPIGTPLTPEEREYITHDVKIVAYALEFFFENGLDKITIGSCALAEFKRLVGKRNFNRWFPILPKEVHEDIRQTYRGGFTYVEPEIAGKDVGNGVVYDVNAMYSGVMRDELLPFGTPIFFQGKYEPDNIYPLYTQMFRCQFELKKGKIPTIQIKHSAYYAGNEYLTSSNDEEVVLCLNSVDLELFLEQYDVYNMEYLSGWKFKATRGIFDKYIEKWQRIKVESKEAGNWGMYLIAKSFLNALYGKFGTSTIRRSKKPYQDQDGIIRYKDCSPEDQDGVYIPMASFITSYARKKIITTAQKIKDHYNAGKSNVRFAYADTDSLHCLTDDFSVPVGLTIDKTELGAWKFESKFNRAKFLRQKCYIENSTEDVNNESPEYKKKITVAGMPPECYESVTFLNFRIGAKYKGKKQPEAVRGGVILKSIDFTIKR